MRFFYVLYLVQLRIAEGDVRRPAGGDGAMMPPSLWPISPTATVDVGPARLEKRQAGEDVAGEVVPGRLRRAPEEPPTPRSSTRRTAMPRPRQWSARTRNGLWPRIVSSRSCAPEPLIKTTAGNGPASFGLVNCRASVILARSLRVSDARPTGKGMAAFGVCGAGLSWPCSTSFRLSGSFAIPCVHVPTASVRLGRR